MDTFYKLKRKELELVAFKTQNLYQNTHSRKIGFTEDGSGEMILTPNAAQEFLNRQQQLRERHYDTGN